MRFGSVSLVALAVAAVPFMAQAQGTPPLFAGIFGDHAVLQRDAPIHVWGTAAPGASLQVVLGADSVAAVTDKDGHWQADLPALPAGGPYSLELNDGAQSTDLKDIMVGDVFLCSGQSNMEFALKYATNSWGMTQIAPDANLRYITVARASSPTPLHDLAAPAKWQTVGPDTGDVSAVCYHMSKAIAKDQGVAVGMIDSFWGGTIIQAWISDQGLRPVKTYDTALDALEHYAVAPDETQAAWNKASRDSWQASEPDVATKLDWIKPGFDDSAWKTMTPSAPWEQSGDPDLANFDGIVWYRQAVTLTKVQAKAARSISLGPVDDADVTWVNGVLVGNTFGYDTPRDYVVPAGTFKAGKNVIVVRALDTGGGGGLWGKPEARKLLFDDGTAMTLPAAWSYKISGQAVPGVTVMGEPWAPPNSPTLLYNAMIAPVAPYSLKGVAWYQGEANAGAAKEYAKLLPAMMADWRRTFNKPDLPFLVVQLANFGAVATTPGASGWAELRESQRTVVDNDAHAGLAVTVDIGDRSDIHPTQKTIVGARLARVAQNIIYGENVSNGGPDVTSVTRSGADLIVTFHNTQGKLLTYSSNEAMGFEVCTAPDVCTYATAHVDGDHIVLPGANTPAATLVRYAWADSPYVNLYSADDLPAVPFEKDISQ